jgi:hypothetical protein
MSSYQWGIVFAAAKMIIWFLVLFLLVARQIFVAPEKRGGRAWADITRMAFATMLIVHGLALIRLYDLFALVGSYILLYLVLLAFRPEGLPVNEIEKLFTRLVLFVMDSLEGRVDYKGLYERQKRNLRERISGWIPARDRLLWDLSFIWLLACAIFIRLYSTMLQAAPSPRFYTHLSWLKGVDRNELFVGGLFPYGFHTLVSALNKFALLDPGLMLRVAGGLGGVLVAVSVYSTVSKFSGRRGGALVAASLYGVLAFGGIFPALPLTFEIVPTELALAFLLPTCGFLTTYILEKDKTSLLLFFQGLASLFLIQPFVGLLALAGIVVGVPLALIIRGQRLKGAGGIIVAAIAAVVIGSIFYGLAFLGGVDAPSDSVTLWNLIGMKDADSLLPQPALTPLCIAALVFIPLLIIPAGREKKAASLARAGGLFFGLYLLALTGLYLSPSIGWPDLFSNSVTGAVLSLVVCAVLGLAWGQVESWLAALWRLVARREVAPEEAAGVGSFVTMAATIVLLAILLLNTPQLLIQGPSAVEYSGVVQNIYRIKGEFLPYTWTVVSTPEALPQIVGSGWYLDYNYFLENYSPETYHYDPEAEEEKTNIPTDHVFIFVEKKVLVTASTAKTVAQRDETQQRLLAWCNRYRELHDDMDVYYEDADVVVYHIYHPRGPDRTG